MADSSLGGVLPPESPEKRPAPQEAPEVRVEPGPEVSAARPETAETAAEAPVEAEPVRATPPESSPRNNPQPLNPSTTPTTPTKDPFLMRVERMLEDDLRELYFALPKKNRDVFRARGEAAAASLRGMLEKPSLRASDADKTIHGWLKAIPDEHPLWLLQETKRKTDGFVALHRERHGLTE